MLGRGHSVWLVEDEIAMARYLGQLLDTHGCRACLFNDPACALAAFRATPDEPDLPITDHTMPVMSGLQLAQQLHGPRPGLPIFLCSGHAGEQVPAAVQRSAIRQFFAKPLAADLLLAALQEQLAPARCARQ